MMASSHCLALVLFFFPHSYLMKTRLILLLIGQKSAQEEAFWLGRYLLKLAKSLILIGIRGDQLHVIQDTNQPQWTKSSSCSTDVNEVALTHYRHQVGQASTAHLNPHAEKRMPFVIIHLFTCTIWKATPSVQSCVYVCKYKTTRMVVLYLSPQQVINLSQIQKSKQKLIERPSFYSIGVTIRRHHRQHSHTSMPCLSFHTLKTKCHTGALV